MKNAFMRGAATLGFLLVLTVGYSLAADPQEGKALVKKNCTGCHGSEVYSRPDRRIDSMDSLRKQVEVCSKNAHTDWNDAQKADVIAYLNEAFYHFK
jgi:mono/diheme cytochrome c family protein